jgi:S-DNA-T family DNA segregation ATPase FtsK/SpoIIIE
VDSKTILDEIGAESLLGRGDMLFKTTDGVSRLHGCWMSDGDIMNFIDRYVKMYNYLVGASRAA